MPLLLPRVRATRSRRRVGGTSTEVGSGAMATYDEILYDVSDPVATITMNRPEFLNAFTQKMGVEIRQAVAEAERDPRVVGIIITGAGRGFCAGADMKMLANIGREDAGDGGDVADPTSVDAVAVGEESWGDDLRGTYMYLMSVPKPIIAAINGPIAGMAVPIALACDLRFMASDAVLTVAFSQRGLIAEWGISWLLPRLAGTGAALDLLMSSRKVTGEECERMGIVNRSVEGDELLDTARRYVMDLAEKCSPASMAIMKKQVYQQLHAGLGPAEKEAQSLM